MTAKLKTCEAVNSNKHATLNALTVSVSQAREALDAAKQRNQSKIA